MTWKKLRGEIDSHIEEKAHELIDAGVPEAEAWQRARSAFGNATLLTEQSRDVWIWTWLERLWQDLVYARRMLTKHAGFTALAVISISLGVGANCAMFSFADAMLLRPLPVPDPSGVIGLGSAQLGATQGVVMSYPDYRDFRARNRSFAELAAFDLVTVNFAARTGDPVERRTGHAVSDNYFAAMQVAPALGRPFDPNETQVPGRDAVVILSGAFWRSQYAADPGVLGRSAHIGGIDFTIVGVMPEEFTGADRWIHPDFYVPAMMLPRLNGGRNTLEDRGWRYFDVKGRLAEGVTIEQARAEAAVLGQALAAEYPFTNRNFTIQVHTELERRLEEGSITGPIVGMLMLLALGVLVVACANVAGLLASRAPARAREMSLRMAIGAGRSRLIRQLLTESAILAVLGAAGGVAVGYAGVQFLKQLRIVAEVPVAFSFRLDERALLFSLVVAGASVFLFGLWPAIRTSKAGLTGSMRGSTSISAPGKPRQWTRNILVTGQIALSIMLLTVAAIMYLTLQRDLEAGPGFRTDHLLLANLDPSLVDYSSGRTETFYRNLVEEARTIPGVRSAALGSGVPGSYELGTEEAIPEHYDFPEGQESAAFTLTRADENYMPALGIPIVRGRGIRADDDEDSAPVAVINEQAAAQYWPGEDAIGKRLRLSTRGSWIEIVGVARNTKINFLVERFQPALYVPFAQHRQARTTLLLESAGDPASLAAPLRELVRRFDAGMPVFGIRNMWDTWNTNAVSPSLLVIQLIAAMGAMGVLLSLTGLYGLMAYSVSARRREIGIRFAVGASRKSVLALMLRQGLVPAGSGALVGLLLGLATGRLMSAVFPSHTPSPALYLLVVPVVFAVAAAALLVPARRAARVDPAIALRQE